MTTTLPTAFVEQMLAQLGEEEGAALCSALTDSAPPVSVRLHPSKPSPAFPTDTTQVLWAARGRYLAERPAFTADPLFHAGTYYVQEAASMFIEQAYRAMEITPRCVLDLCAAPGGKSTHWRSLLPEDTLLVANEPVPLRAAVLAENLAKWGHPATIVTQAYPAAWGEVTGLFDVIAADVPCSGEGMFRKDAVAVAEWSPHAVTLCAERQRDIIAEVWQALRVGGYLVYSTCTFNAAECEDNVRFICDELGAEVIPVPVEAAWGAVTTAEGVHFYPHRAQGEGFFLSLLRKTEGEEGQGKKKKLAKGGCIKRVYPQQVASWLAAPQGFAFFSPDTDLLAAIPEQHWEALERIARSVRILRAGVLVAAAKGKKLIPQPELALSLALSETAFPRINLSYEDAIAYLRREALTLPPDVPKGYVVVCYESCPLGFVNQLGNRANNLYPNEWRIRKKTL